MSLSVDIEKRLGTFRLRVKLETSGGVLGMLGASGSGKSTTLMCVAGVQTPDRGTIILNGVTLFDSKRRINLPPQQRRIGYLFQHYALFPNMTVRQNIRCGLRSDQDAAQKEKKIDEMLNLLQIKPLESLNPAQLSGGEAQRVALARILVGNPNLLLLDEPFNALDSHLRGQLQMQMREILQQFGKDTLLVTHSRSEAYRLCETIALTHDGEILTVKGVKELFADPESRQAAYLTGCKNVADAWKTGEYEVEVPAWGARLTTARPVRNDLCAVAIRAHYFNPQSEQNRYPVRFTGEIEEPFEYTLTFRYEKQAAGTPDLWWRIPKDGMRNPPPTALGIATMHILPLYR